MTTYFSNYYQDSLARLKPAKEVVTGSYGIYATINLAAPTDGQAALITLQNGDVLNMLSLPDRVTVQDGTVFANNLGTGSYTSTVGDAVTAARYLSAAVIVANGATVFYRQDFLLGIPFQQILADTINPPRVAPVSIFVTTAATAQTQGTITLQLWLSRDVSAQFGGSNS